MENYIKEAKNGFTWKNEPQNSEIRRKTLRKAIGKRLNLTR